MSSLLQMTDHMKAVLQAVLLHRPISRAQVAAVTGINKVTVSQSVEALIKKGLFTETGEQQTGAKGRPPILLDIQENAGIIIGMELDTQYCRYMVTTLSGQKLEQRFVPLHDTEPSYFLEVLRESIESTVSAYSEYTMGIVGVGLALPGHYNERTGVVEYMANQQKWNGFPLRDEIRHMELGIPFIIERVPFAAALGELHFGHFSESLVSINSFWGLGVAYCMEGQLFRGSSGYAGRLAHSTIDRNGRTCSCGNIGCWEMYASIKALCSELGMEQPKSPEFIHDIVNRLERKEPAVLAAVQQLAHHLAVGLVTVINVYNPSDICFGGFLGLLLPDYLPMIRAELEQRLPKHMTADVHLYCSELRELSVAYGAISLVRNQLHQFLAV